MNRGDYAEWNGGSSCNRGPGTTKVEWRDALITLCSITGSLVGTQTPFTSCIGPIRLRGWAALVSAREASAVS